VVKPWIIKHSFDILGLSNIDQSGDFYITQNDIEDFNPTNYTISGSLTFTAPQTQSSIIALSEKVDETVDFGLQYKKIWDGLPNTYSQWKTGSTRNITRTISISQLQTAPGDPVPLSVSDPSFFLLSVRKSSEVQRVGVGSADDAAETVFLDVHRSTFIENYLFVDIANSSFVVIE